MKEIGFTRSSIEAGRKGTKLEFNQRSHAVIGVEITDTFITCLLVDLAGKVLIEQTLPGSSHLQYVMQIIHRFYLNSEAVASRILGCTVCSRCSFFRMDES